MLERKSKTQLTFFQEYKYTKHFLLERLSPNRQHHELLHGKFVSCVRSSIYDVKCLKEGGTNGFYQKNNRTKK